MPSRDGNSCAACSEVFFFFFFRLQRSAGIFAPLLTTPRKCVEHDLIGTVWESASIICSVCDGEDIYPLKLRATRSNFLVWFLRRIHRSFRYRSLQLKNFHISGLVGSKPVLSVTSHLVISMFCSVTLRSGGGCVCLVSWYARPG